MELKVITVKYQDRFTIFPVNPQWNWKLKGEKKVRRREEELILNGIESIEEGGQVYVLLPRC